MSEDGFGRMELLAAPLPIERFLALSGQERRVDRIRYPDEQIDR